MSSLITDGEIVDHQAIREIADLLKAADLFTAESNNGSHADFLEYFQWYKKTSDDEVKAASDNSDAPVILQTIHGSKGLEYPAVFVIGLANRKFPGADRRALIGFPREFYKDDLPANEFRINEERRLLYVAMTRAEEKLFLYGVDKKRSRISRFVIELLDCPDFDTVGVKEDIASIESLPNKEYGPRDIATKPGAIILPIGDDIPSMLSAGLMKIWSVISSVAKTDDEYQKLKAEWLESVDGASSKFKDNIAMEKFREPAAKVQFKIDSLSYTDMNSFDLCPMRFYFSKILRMPSPSGPQLVFGSVIHSILEEGGKRLIAGEEVSVDMLLSEFESRWHHVVLDDPDRKERLRQKAKDHLANFVAMQSKMSGKTVDVEKSFKFVVGDTQVRGKIDRVDQTPDGIEIVDYKTGKRDNKKLKSDLQLPVYSMACRELYGKYPAKVTYMFLTEDEPFSQSPEDLEKIECDITEKIEEIQNSDFTATPDTFKCGYCGYNRICPAKI